MTAAEPAERGDTTPDQVLGLAGTVSRAVIDAALDCVILMDEAGILREFNPAAERVFGHDRRSVIGRPLGDVIVPPRLRSAHAAGLARLIATGQSRMVGRRIELEAMRSDGSLFPIELAIVELRLDGRRMFAAYLRDLTERQRAEAEIRRQRDALHQSEKVAALGSLLAGIAHELNNPLSVVMGRASMLEEDARYPELAVPLARLRAAAERCSGIVKSFLAIVRRSAGARQAIALAGIVDSALGTLEYSLTTAGIDVLRQVDGDGPVVWGEAERLHQLILNLLINAQQALAEAPTPRRLWITLAAEPDGARLEIADSGPGIPPALRDRIFEPFFTTKPPGAGTGIGLPLCMSIVTGHGGTLLVDERPGGGARFTVRFPFGERAELVPTSARAVSHPVRLASILVVDDETEITAMLQETLERDGHRVVIARSGNEALAGLAADRFDLVLSDLRMADGDGIELYRAIGARYPELVERFVVMTGDTLGATLDRLPPELRERRIEKPMDLAVLRRVLADRLAALRGRMPE